MIETFNLGTIEFEFWEWIAIPAFIAIIYFLGARYKIKKIGRNPEYKYFLSGLMFKVFAGLFFGLIYVFYYGGGDTISYYSSAIPLSKLFWENTIDYFDVIFYSDQITEQYSQMEWEAFTFNVFTPTTGVPLSFISHDPKTFMVSKLTSPLLIVCGNSYFLTTIVLSMLTYFPLWRLYQTMLRNFPILKKELAWGVLFIPSVAFWGSGIMKDTFTFAAVAIAINAFDHIMNAKNVNIIRFWYFLILIFSLFMIISIKPYIINILVPCLGLWLVVVLMVKIKNVIFKFIVLPVLFTLGLGGSLFVLQSLSGSMDKFALDKAVETAVITNDDLKREEQYGSNNFDIGTLDGSIPNLISKFPQATFAGLFRPLVIESASPVMLLSGLENLALLGLLVLTLVKIKFRLILHLIRGNPLLLFCFSFAILFGFMIGITTPNFGALVRFKIPLTPFLAVGLIVIYSTYKIVNQDNKKGL